MMRNFSKAEIARAGKRFGKAKPFPHVIIENFLAGNEHKKLLQELKKEKFFRKDTDLFSFSQTGNLFYSKLPLVIRAVKMFSSKEFAKLAGDVSGIKVTAGAVDVSGSLYEKADYLLCHDDRLEGRKIAFILYLSESFTASDGGALVFLTAKGKHPDKKVIAYPPLENSLMMFTVSEKSWHEVEEMLSDKKRYTIGGWLNEPFTP